MRQHAARDDPDGGAAIRAAGRVAALGHGPVRDVCVRPDQVVGVDVAEHDGAVALEPGAHADFRRSPANRLERLLERQHEPDRPPEPERHERHEWLVLRVLLATEPAARVGRDDPDLRQWQPHEVGNHPLKPVRVLDRAPHSDPVAVRRGHERVRLDGELGDHREGVVALDHDVGLALGRLDVAPRIAVLAQDVRAREWVVRPEGRVLDERRIAGAGRRHGMDRGKLLEIDPHEARGLLGGVERLGGDRGHGVAVELGLDDREHGPVPKLGAEARHRVREVGGGHDEPDAGHGHGYARIDPADPCPRHVERDELHMQDVLEGDVGDVLLPPGDAFDPTDARRRLPDRHCGATSASGVDDRSPMSGPAARAGPPGAASAAASTASKICS